MNSCFSHYLYSSAGKIYLENRYVEQRRTPRNLAEELVLLGIKNNHALIRRALKFHKIKIRDKAEAQAEALKSERATHPTKGKVRPDSVKQQISSKLKDRNNESTS